MNNSRSDNDSETVGPISQRNVKPLAPARILIVDDHPPNLLVLEAVLEPLNQTVVQTRSGEEALVLLAKNDFAVVLLDVRMPTMDGFETASRIRSGPRNRGIPIIFLTAFYGDTSYSASAYSVGAVDFLTKPYDPEILRAKVTVFIDLFNAHERVREQAARLRLSEHVLRQTPDAVIVTDRDGKIVDWTGNSENIFGFSLEHAVGQPLSIIGSGDGKITAQIFSEIQKNGRISAEMNCVRSDGREILTESIADLVRDEHGQPIGMITVHRDITERRRADLAREELMLHQAAAHEFRTLAESIAQLAWIANPQGEVFWWNQRWFDYTGTTQDEMKTLGAERLHDPVVFETIVRSWRASVASGKPFAMQFPLRRADGVFRWFLTQVMPVVDQHGTIVRWFGTATDIDDQRQAERERERLITALERSNRELDQFAYVASHDLKAPLRGIANLSHWIEDDIGSSMTEETRVHLQLLRGRAHRLEALIDGVLSLSRAGRDNERTEEIDVSEVIAEVTDLLAMPPESKIIVDESVPKARGQRVAMQQILLNLIGNALKHSRRSDTTITISAKDLGTHWEFAVSDNGPGIAPEFHDRIWNMFQTLEARDRIENTGIGLAVVRKIVEAQGGQTRVESALGSGATFLFTWPK